LRTTFESWTMRLMRRGYGRILRRCRGEDHEEGRGEDREEERRGVALDQMARIWGRILLGHKGPRRGIKSLQHGTYFWAALTLITLSAATDEFDSLANIGHAWDLRRIRHLTLYMYAHIYIYPSQYRAQQNARIRIIHFTSSNFNTHSTVTAQHITFSGAAATGRQRPSYIYT
jgi:hypothetical protein